MKKPYWSRDVLVFIKTKLINELNTMIGIVNGERLDDTPLISNITYDKVTDSLPECLIELTESTIDQEEIGNENDFSTEIFNCVISIMSKSNDNRHSLWIENYLEALWRVLQGYNDNYISWIRLKQSVRADLTSTQDQTYKICGYNIEIRIF